MVRDIFISYVDEDKSLADTICNNLENYGLQCWIAPRNIAPGEKYAPAIIHAIDNSKIVVVVFSHYSDQSEHVKTEIERAFNHAKMIIPFRIENIEPSDEMQYFIGSRQWLDAFSGSLDEHTNRLADIIKKHLNVEPAFSENQEKTPSSQVKQSDTFNEGNFPKKIAPSKLYQIICRSISYSIDFGIGLVLGLLYSWFYPILATVVIGQENFNLLTYLPNSNSQLTPYGNYVSGVLYLAGIIFWFIIIDISRPRSPGKALSGLKIYWPSDKMNSEKWRTIRSLIKNAPLLTLFLGAVLGSGTSGGLMTIIAMILWITWVIPVIFTAKSQSVHDRIVGTVVYFG